MSCSLLAMNGMLNSNHLVLLLLTRKITSFEASFGHPFDVNVIE